MYIYWRLPHVHCFLIKSLSSPSQKTHTGSHGINRDNLLTRIHGAGVKRARHIVRDVRSVVGDITNYRVRDFVRSVWPVVGDIVGDVWSVVVGHVCCC